MIKKIGEAARDQLTELLLQQVQEITKLPVKDGLSVKINPFEKSVWVGYRKSW